LKRRSKASAGYSSSGVGVVGLVHDDLVEAGSRADLAAGRQRRTGEKVAGLGAVDVPLEGLLVVEAADEEHFFLEVG
jgi:hypothetical protein